MRITATNFKSQMLIQTYDNLPSAAFCEFANKKKKHLATWRITFLGEKVNCCDMHLSGAVKQVREKVHQKMCAFKLGVSPKLGA